MLQKKRATCLGWRDCRKDLSENQRTTLIHTASGERELSWGEKHLNNITFTGWKSMDGAGDMELNEKPQTPTFPYFSTTKKRQVEIREGDTRVKTERERDRAYYENINSMIIYLKYLCWMNTLQAYILSKHKKIQITKLRYSRTARGSFLEGWMET